MIQQRIAPLSSTLPSYRGDILGAPEWLKSAMGSLVVGYIDVVPEIHVREAPDRYRLAASVEGLEWVWRHDGSDVWTLVSVYDGPCGPAFRMNG